MHIPLPKPLHGWRAFVGEVGIIVLGVLIALAFGQLAPVGPRPDRGSTGARGDQGRSSRESVVGRDSREL